MSSPKCSKELTMGVDTRGSCCLALAGSGNRAVSMPPALHSYKGYSLVREVHVRLCFVISEVASLFRCRGEMLARLTV